MQSTPPPSFELVPGMVLDRKFRIERIIGQGGMGTVLAAVHLQLDQLVAIKLLLPELAVCPEAAARFQREARAAVKIRSEHVARVLDVAQLEDGTPYMVMEYLEGTDLAALVHDHGPVDVTAAATYVLEALDAIAAAHALGIIHRDLKPANLFLAKLGDETSGIKVLDFGISKLSQRLSTHDATLTSSRALMGSPLYMAPEQMQSAKHVDLRTDIWALGCVLFELVTGRPPFVADAMPELCALILTEPAPVPSQIRPELPPQLDAVIGRCLEKLPAARYAGAAELANALLPFAPAAAPLVDRILRRTASSRPPPSASAQVQGEALHRMGVQTAAAWGQPTRPGMKLRSNRRIATALAGAVVVLAAVGGWLASRASSGKDQLGPTVAARSAEASAAFPASTSALLPAAVAPTASLRGPAASVQPTESDRPTRLKKARAAPNVPAAGTSSGPAPAGTAPPPRSSAARRRGPLDLGLK